MNIGKQGSIKVGLAALLLFFTTFSFADQSQASSSTACAQCENPRDIFPAAFDFAQLETPTTPQELLRLIRVISENFLLLDPRFEAEDFLKKLFDSSSITDPYAAYPPRGGGTSRIIHTGENSAFKTQFQIGEIAFSYGKLSDENPMRSLSHISIMLKTKANPFNADLVMKEMRSGAKWRDPLVESNPFSIRENADNFLRRPQPTDPRGYFEADFIDENSKVISKLTVELHHTGTLRLITLVQQDKKK